MRKRWWIGIIILIVLIGGVVGYGFLGGRQGPSGALVMTAMASQGDLQQEVFTTGKVVSKEEITLFSQYNGLLQGFSLKKGDKVTKGEVLAYLDDSDDSSDLENDILSKEAQLEIEKINLKKLQQGPESEELTKLEEQIFQEQIRYEGLLKERERLEQLYTSGAATLKELEKVNEELILAESAVTVAKQALLQVQKGPKTEDVLAQEALIQKLQREIQQLTKKRSQMKNQLISSAGGTVIELKAKNGQYVNKGTEIATIVDLNNLEVIAEVSEADISRIEIGQEAVIEGISLGEQQLRAKVMRIEPTARQTGDGRDGRTTVGVVLELEKIPAILKPGFQVDVSIINQKASQVVMVPFEAIQEDGESSYIWVVEEGLAKKRAVQTGLENELYTEITSGLQATEKIILNPGLIQENDPILEMDQSSLYQVR